MDAPDINKCAESGPFTLFTIRQPTTATCDGVELSKEKLHLRVFSDADVLEVFANDRFAIATMVYSRNYGSAAAGVTAFVTAAREVPPLSPLESGMV